MLTQQEFNQIVAAIKVMGGAIINQEPHVPERNVIYLLQEFIHKDKKVEVISIPCIEEQQK
jgi:hypothetical protein